MTMTAKEIIESAKGFMVIYEISGDRKWFMIYLN